MRLTFFIIKTTIIIAIIYAIYVFLYKHLMKKYGCTKDEADTAIYCKLTSREYKPEYDNDLYYEINNTMQIVLGDTRYKKWVDIGTICPVIQFSSNGLSCINIVAPYETEKEKEQFQAMLSEIFRQHLRCYGVFHSVLIDWKEHPVLRMPYIQLRYAKDLYENQAIKKLIREEVKKAIEELNSKPPTDDEEDDIS